MNKLTASLLASIASLLTGCGNVAVFGHTIGEPKPVSRSAATDTSQPRAAATLQKVKTVSVALTTEAAAKVAGDTRFDTDTLLAAINSELQSRGALDASDPQITAVAEITIDNFALDPVSNAILFGRIIYTGKLNGVLRVRDANSNELSNRRIDAKSQVSIVAEGETKNPLASLYGQFAALTGNELTGKVIKPVQDDSWRPR